MSALPTPCPPDHPSAAPTAGAPEVRLEPLTLDRLDDLLA